MGARWIGGQIGRRAAGWAGVPQPLASACEVQGMSGIWKHLGNVGLLTFAIFAAPGLAIIEMSPESEGAKLAGDYARAASMAKRVVERAC